MRPHVAALSAIDTDLLRPQGVSRTNALRQPTSEEATERAGSWRLSALPLIARGQPAGPALGECAGSVGVSPATGVSLGHDEHVLGQRREEVVAERAAVGRGLEVLGGADRPPARPLLRLQNFHDICDRTGERVRISVNRRPVAELVPLARPRWTSGASMEHVLQEASADAALKDDLAAIRGEVIEPRE